jgi:hypothetical protein
MKKCLLTVTALIVAALPCWARLGETEEQSIARYGQPIRTFHTAIKGEVRHDYWKDYFLVKAIFFQGACCSISFKKAVSPDEAYKGPGIKFTEAEEKLLLDQNNQGHSWTKAADDGGGDVWSRDDGGDAVVIGAFFCIDSPEFGALAKLAKAANQNADAAAAQKSVGGL